MFRVSWVLIEWFVNVSRASSIARHDMNIHEFRKMAFWCIAVLWYPVRRLFQRSEVTKRTGGRQTNNLCGSRNRILLVFCTSTMATFNDLKYDWSMLCQECPECWSESGESKFPVLSFFLNFRSKFHSFVKTLAPLNRQMEIPEKCKYIFSKNVQNWNFVNGIFTKYRKCPKSWKRFNS